MTRTFVPSFCIHLSGMCGSGKKTSTVLFRTRQAKVFVDKSSESEVYTNTRKDSSRLERQDFVVTLTSLVKKSFKTESPRLGDGEPGLSITTPFNVPWWSRPALSTDYDSRPHSSSK
jgi:hypothetical protein